MADAPLPTPHRARTALLANLAAVLERCDEQMVPAVYRSLGAAFSATPTQLGYIALSRALVQALTSPIGGIAGGPDSSLPLACPVLWNWRACGSVAPSSAPAPLPVSAQPLPRLPTPAHPPALPRRPLPAPRPRGGLRLPAVERVHRRLCRLQLVGGGGCRVGRQRAGAGLGAAQHTGAPRGSRAVVCCSVPRIFIHSSTPQRNVRHRAGGLALAAPCAQRACRRVCCMPPRHIPAQPHLPPCHPFTSLHLHSQLHLHPTFIFTSTFTCHLAPPTACRASPPTSSPRRSAAAPLACCTSPPPWGACWGRCTPPT